MKVSTLPAKLLKHESQRFDAPFYINDAVTYRKSLDACPYRITTAGEECKTVFLGNIFTRAFVSDPEYGIPYLTASEMQKSDLYSGKYLSKKMSASLKYLMLHKDWILISCSGSLGNCVYTDSRYEDMIGTHDLIRYVPRKHDLYEGYVYAFFSSRFGFASLTHSQYGSVIQHINPDHVKAIPIPIFPDELQHRIHSLITESARLREEANAALRTAVDLFESNSEEKGIQWKQMDGSVGKSKILSSWTRFDARYLLGTKQLEAEKKKCRYPQQTIQSFTKDIFVGYRGKRHYCTNGVPFISSSDMLLFNPKRYCKIISQNTPDINTIKVHENDILISCSGTVGNAIIVGKDLEQTTISAHILNLIIDETKISPMYVFCYLKTAHAKSYMEASAYGSVIIELNKYHLGAMTIPILPSGIYQNIVTEIGAYKEKLSSAAEKENEAIRLVEEEIEKWQK